MTSPPPPSRIPVRNPARLSPSRSTPRTKMALNPEPADPTERYENGLSQKSFAEAVKQNGDDNDSAPETSNISIDETAIKETPPKTLSGHLRNGSAKSLDEIVDEPSSPTTTLGRSSPTLRHPKGRLEEKGSRESYAEALRRSSEQREDAREEFVNGHGGKHGDDGTRTPEKETYEGEGEDEAPRSPTVRKGHKRVSSREMNGNANGNGNGTTTSPIKDELQRVLSPDEPVIPDNLATTNVTNKNGGDGDLIYENLYNKSGENLASLKPGEGYYLSLARPENKPPSQQKQQQQQRPPNPSEPPALPQRPTTDNNSDLVSGRQAGAGWSRSAIRWAPWNVPLQRRLQTLVVLLHTLSIAGGLALFFLLCTIPLLWPLLLPYLLYVLISRAATDGKLSHRSERFRQSKIWSLFASYFPARLHRSAELEAGRKYVFGYHPHGIISHGAFAAFATEALGFGTLFPGIKNTLLTLDANFRIPLYRDYALRMGLASVSRESCENILTRGGPNNEGMGRAITIVIGGARESLDARPYSMKLVLKRRKGFVKLAIRTGADLVPVLAFGENDIYEQLDTEKHPWVHKGQMGVKKFMGFTVPLFHARGVFNYDVGIMPYRRPINIVVGRPVQVLQQKNPDAAYVDEIHEKYIQELIRVWDDWKDTFASERRGELEIVE